MARPRRSRTPGRATRFPPGAANPAIAAGPRLADDAGALALTFARAVAPVKKPGPLVPIGGGYYPSGGDGWIAG